jgi:hypothetical protein
MYKCGWNGCEKAYGTLNHLNAHVTMQSHGTKRTPEGKISLPFAPRFVHGKRTSADMRLHRIQGDPQRMEGTQEGRRERTKSGRGASPCCPSKSGRQPASRRTSSCRPGIPAKWSSTFITTHWLSVGRQPRPRPVCPAATRHGLSSQ